MSRRFAASSAATMALSAASSLLVLSIIIAGVIIPSAAAFHLVPSVSSIRANTSSSCRRASSSISASADDATMMIENAKQQINQAISNTDKGRSGTSTQRSQILSKLIHLESLNPTPNEPTRSPLVDGPWIVLYTDAPPPSNGQLGLFKGVAKQVIDLKRGTYRNELYVGGGGVEEDENAWLEAVLEATWKEWDGVYLDDGGDDKDDDSSVTATTTTSDTSSNIIDHGATTWRVDFIKLTLSIFQIPIFTQSFKEGTARIWKMTYLDEDTRIVRAGKTGRGEDDWIFYMRRGRR